jgi:hypothetical protein
VLEYRRWHRAEKMLHRLHRLHRLKKRIASLSRSWFLQIFAGLRNVVFFFLAVCGEVAF